MKQQRQRKQQQQQQRMLIVRYSYYYVWPNDIFLGCSSVKRSACCFLYASPSCTTEDSSSCTLKPHLCCQWGAQSVCWGCQWHWELSITLKLQYILRKLRILSDVADDSVGECNSGNKNTETKRPYSHLPLGIFSTGHNASVIHWTLNTNYTSVKHWGFLLKMLSVSSMVRQCRIESSVPLLSSSVKIRVFWVHGMAYPFSRYRPYSRDRWFC